MSQKTNATEKKMTLIPLILMIFTSVFGFNNIPRSFYLMGYSAIPWYIFSGVLFFIPYAFMMAEYGSAFKNESGGIYSWMQKSVGPKYAFITTFMWYASYIIWLVNISSGIWIVVSTAIFGTDLTNKLNLFGLNSTQSMGVLGVLLMTAFTFIASKGLNKISKIASIGGIATTLLNLVLLFGALIVYINNGFKLAQPIESISTGFFVSPNSDFLSGLSIASFLVFAIFAYGGIEVVGGLVDKTENPEKTFPKGITIAAIVIAIGYAIGIFMVGMFTNWDFLIEKGNVHIGNFSYVCMENLGYQIAISFKANTDTAIFIGKIMSRYMGISIVLCLTGAFFTLLYSPLKQLIEGTPKEMWPSFVSKIENDMPKNAMWIQWAIVIVFVCGVTFGGEGASKFFMKLTLMTNVAMTIPYLLIALAFPKFKNNQSIKKPFVIFKTAASVKLATFFTVLLVGFANIATIIEPSFKGKYDDTIWMVIGPIFFTILALGIYKKYEIKKARLEEEELLSNKNLEKAD
ncbi:MAG: glutamate/gamma-aminobutyrate family transporter YjeM [Cetobacterium sp.]